MRLMWAELIKLARPLTWGVAAPLRCSVCCWPPVARTTPHWKPGPQTAIFPRAPS